MKRVGRFSRVFLLSISAGLFAGAALFVALVNGAGPGYCPYSFVPPYHQYKCERLKRATSPKLVVLGGSFAQECLFPDVISRELGMDVVLAGTFVNIPMRFYRAMLEDCLRAGDVLYLPLEHLYYARGEDEVLSVTGVSMLLGVDPSLRSTLRPKERFDLYVRKGLGWLQCVIPKRFPHCTYTRYRSNSLCEMVRKNPGCGWLHGLGPFGQDMRNCPTMIPEDAILHLPNSFSDEFRYSFQRLLELAKERRVKVVIGNAVNYSYLRDKGVARFCEEQAKLGLPVCCSPLELCLPYGCLSDSCLHCNDAGKKYVTHQVVRGLKRILKGVEDPPGAWPLVFFAESKPDSVSFELPETCLGRETFAEVILDRGQKDCTNVVRRICVNGRDVAFSERVHAAKNALWMRWRDNTGRADIRIEFLDSASECRGERILVEPYRLDELQRITNFNEVVGFRLSPGNPRRYEATASAGHLAFRVPDWASNRYRCRLCFRVDPQIGAFAWGGPKSFRWITDRSSETDGVMEIQIVPNESDGFVDEKGDGVFGLRFDWLPPGVSIELVSCEFDLV